MSRRIDRIPNLVRIEWHTDRGAIACAEAARATSPPLWELSFKEKQGSSTARPRWRPVERARSW